MPSMRYRPRSSFSYGSMWMSLAPFEMADIRMTLTSLMTGASSPWRASVSALISSRSSMTSTSPPSAVAGISPSAPAGTPRALSPTPRPPAEGARGDVEGALSDLDDRGRLRRHVTVAAVVLLDGLEQRRLRGDHRL